MTTHNKWAFWIDRGGTFTDVVARDPQGELHIRKYLSENPEQYEDPGLHAIRQLLDLQQPNQVILDKLVETIKMGTTVATNALLEHKGEPVCLVTTKGFADLLEIGYQDRPELFALEIKKPEKLATEIIEIDERILADGTVRKQPNREFLKKQLQAVHDKGIQSVAVLLLHAYAYPEHERIVGEVVREIGFTNLSMSHEVAREIKVVARGDTTMVDAYLTPKLRQYIASLRKAVGDKVNLRFMQSHGGLADAEHFSGKDAILSGPAGGVVACAHIAKLTGLSKLIGFDMGGTSTDVSRYDGTYERIFESKIAGVRIQAPMLNIVTVAAGGGSILDFVDGRMQVGPESAGANPGPTCYRRGGPLAVTDANAVLGRIQAKYFPECFGPQADQPIDVEATKQEFKKLVGKIETATGKRLSIEEIAAGFLRIANENMIKPIREISLSRGYDVREYALYCFGGAGAQQACAIASALGMKTILLHPLAGVLSAYGMGLADNILTDVEAVLKPLNQETIQGLEKRFSDLGSRSRQKTLEQGFSTDQVHHVRSLDIRYQGVEEYLNIAISDNTNIREKFEQFHDQLYSFIKEGHPIEIVNLRLETHGETSKPEEPTLATENRLLDSSHAIDSANIYFDYVDESGKRQLKALPTPIFRRTDIAQKSGTIIQGPALIIEDVSTVVVDPGWKARVDEFGHLFLESEQCLEELEKIDTERDPVLLEVFNNLFMSIAEQMGIALNRVSHSTNIKERLDYSCALFDGLGDLIANAPHIPVHLGAMGDSVRAVIEARGDTMKPGEVYLTNDPFHGGSHLPDVTAVTPVFESTQAKNQTPIAYVANRGHHADIGGPSPGSMPPFSRTIEDEGILIHNFLLVEDNHFREKEIVERLQSGKHPARNITERLNDLRAAVAANATGVRLLGELNQRYSVTVVQAFMGHVKKNAEESMRAVLAEMPDGKYEFYDFLDEGTRIAVSINIEGDHASVDFTGTDRQIPSNLNAPRAIVAAAVLYVFRTLIPRPIPLNAGCLIPIKLNVPEGSVLSPRPPAAVVGGNVETSMRITDVLYGALEKLAAGQGTMNCFSFGNDQFGYVETICGGAGAGFGFDGADAVHTHMTNTRITDPEVIERRYPVVLKAFQIRYGTGGNGVWRGGDGVRRKVEFLEPMSAAILSERRNVAPYGMHGAENGSRGRNAVIQNGRLHELPGKAQLQIKPGDVFIIETPAGGGYNPSTEQWASMSPAQARQLIRESRYQGPTLNIAKGYQQANLMVLSANDLDRLLSEHPSISENCQILEQLQPGDPFSRSFARGADIRTDLPYYHIHRADGGFAEACDIRKYFLKAHVAILYQGSLSLDRPAPIVKKLDFITNRGGHMLIGTEPI